MLFRSPPPVPTGEAEFRHAVDEVHGGLMPDHAAQPRWRAEGNDAFWTAYFQRRHDQDVADRGNNDPIEGRCNSISRKRWWGGDHRTLQWVVDYIEAGNEPRLAMPPRPSWTPRRMGWGSSSSGTSSSSGVRSAGADWKPRPPRFQISAV